MIDVNQVSKSFNTLAAVRNVSLAVKAGEIMGLVGPDGAGKTTLLRMICGLIDPDSGEIHLQEKTLRHLDEARKDLGYMPQRFSLYGDLTVMENIFFFGSMYSLNRKSIQKRADEILEITNLSPFKNRFADNLSGGMKQKLALTCALITRPGILVLDEPTYGVDPESRKDFWKILYDLNRAGMTILVSTPYMDEAELCTRVAFISEGQIKVENTPSELKQSFPYPVLQIMLNGRQSLNLAEIPGVLDVSNYGSKYHVVVKEQDKALAAIQDYLQANKIVDVSIREVKPSMEDVFVALAEGGVNQWNLQ